MGLFSPLHVGMLAAIGALSAAAAVAPRAWPGRWVVAARVAVGAILLVAEAAWWAALFRDPSQVSVHGVPLEICDTNVLVTCAALWWRARWPAEVSWFWAFAGGIPSLLTPSPAGAFPDWLYFQYFVVHGGLVVAASFLAIGLGLPPGRGAVARVLGVTAAYAAAMAVVDWATGLNVMYLRGYPPGPPTLLNVLGPWPWYLLSVAAITCLLFVLLDAPFRPGRRRARDAVRGSPAPRV